jgi:hypothetical protein
VIAPVAMCDGAEVFGAVEAVVGAALSSARSRIAKAIANAELSASRRVPMRLLGGWRWWVGWCVSMMFSLMAGVSWCAGRGGGGGRCVVVRT